MSVTIRPGAGPLYLCPLRERGTAPPTNGECREWARRRLAIPTVFQVWIDPPPRPRVDPDQEGSSIQTKDGRGSAGCRVGQSANLATRGCFREARCAVSFAFRAGGLLWGWPGALVDGGG